MCSEANNPCKNDGVCTEGTAGDGTPRAICDCSEVADFEGKTCEDIRGRRHQSYSNDICGDWNIEKD